jgi:hypothetical protein
MQRSSKTQAMSQIDRARLFLNEIKQTSTLTQEEEDEDYEENIQDSSEEEIEEEEEPTTSDEEFVVPDDFIEYENFKAKKNKVQLAEDEQEVNYRIVKKNGKYYIKTEEGELFEMNQAQGAQLFAEQQESEKIVQDSNVKSQ